MTVLIRRAHNYTRAKPISDLRPRSHVSRQQVSYSVPQQTVNKLSAIISFLLAATNFFFAQTEPSPSPLDAANTYEELPEFKASEILRPEFLQGDSKAVPLPSLCAALRCRKPPQVAILFFSLARCKIRFPRNTIVPQVNDWNEPALNLSGVARMETRHHCG